jgi:tRNA A-37 threonylcarbamoyl transferase component Bud32
MRIQLVPNTLTPDFLDLPWERPLDEWQSERLVEVARGVGRHVVRFVDYGGTFFALKELPQPIALKEYRLLRRLQEEGLPTVQPAGVVLDRGDDNGVLITRYLEYSLPFRLIVRRRLMLDFMELLLDGVAELLVRMHLAGFFWGDCSLSNTLFRRDAGALAPYLVDTETGELHEQLSDGQRGYDIEIAEQNLAGELADVEAEYGSRRVSRDPFAFAEEVCTRYDRLWRALTADEELAAGEQGRVQDRLRRVNELGFDVEEVELATTDRGYRLSVRSPVVEAGHHRRRLLHLTGLEAQENQARRLLADVEAFRKSLEKRGQPAVSETAAAGRWLNEAFEPAIAAVPRELFGKREPAELFHELLEHRWFLSESAGRDVGLDEAVRAYVEDVLRGLPDERAAVRDELDA